MKAHFFHALVCLTFIFSLLFVGFALSLIPMASDWVYYLTEKLNSYPEFFAKIGKIFIISALSLLFLFYFINRKTFYTVILEPKLSYSLNNKAVSRVISDFLKKDDFQKGVSYKINIYGKNIELLADLSNKPLEEHEEILESLEMKLGKLLENQIGLPNKLTVNVLTNKF